MTMELAIETRGLTKMFEDKLAVNALDLEVAKGSVYGFLGLNGAGKTTTIKMLLNLVYPTSGEAFVLGHDVVKQALYLVPMVWQESLPVRKCNGHHIWGRHNFIGSIAKNYPVPPGQTYTQGGCFYRQIYCKFCCVSFGGVGINCSVIY